MSIAGIFQQSHFYCVILEATASPSNFFSNNLVPHQQNSFIFRLRILLLVALEYCWNVYPQRSEISLLLFLIHLLLLVRVTQFMYDLGLLSL